MRKAEMLLARAMADSTGPQSAELLAQAAAGYYRGGQLDRALAAYDQASQRAREMRQPEQAFQSAFTAATIEKERHHYRDALARYRALAAQPEEPKAAEAHLLAVYCAAQLAQAEQPPKLDEYDRLLREHVAAWPDGPTSSQARTWLGRLAVHRGDWQDAIDTLRHVKPADPHFADAVATMGSAYDAWFDDLHQRGANAGRLPDEALDWFERVSPPPGGKPNAATRAAVLAAARIWLKEVPTGALPAERLLREALDYDSLAPKEWQAAARSLLVLALAAQSKRNQADTVLEQVPRASVPDALALLQMFWDVRRRASVDVQRNLAEVELAAEEDLLNRRERLDAATLQAVTRERALTLAALGRRKDALAELQTLARAYPRDGQTQEAWARLLSSGDEPDLRAALTKWGEVANRSRPGTPRWFRAHDGLARAQFELGQVAAARATIARVKSKHPDFGGESMKRQFDQLSAEIEHPPERASPRN
jgi:tetratricopeptide (TPR) repeat protein